jgi:hypothetical protein
MLACCPQYGNGIPGSNGDLAVVPHGITFVGQGRSESSIYFGRSNNFHAYCLLGAAPAPGTRRTRLTARPYQILGNHGSSRGIRDYAFGCIYRYYREGGIHDYYPLYRSLGHRYTDVYSLNNGGFPVVRDYRNDRGIGRLLYDTISHFAIKFKQ